MAGFHALIKGRYGYADQREADSFIKGFCASRNYISLRRQRPFLNYSFTLAAHKKAASFYALLWKVSVDFLIRGRVLQFASFYQ